jgi:hypothetical protein
LRRLLAAPRPAGRPGLVIGVVAGVVVLAPVLGRGYALSYDMVFVPQPPITAHTLGVDGSVPRAVPSDLVVALLARILPADVVQQAILLLVFVLAGWGVARLLPGPVAGAAAAVGYVWNPYVDERLVLGHWVYLVGYAVLPWVAGAALAVRRGQRLPALLLWLAGAAVAGSTAGVLATGLALAILGVRPAPRRAAAVLAFAAAVNAPWWLPVVARAGGTPADPAGVTAFAARADSPLGVLGSLATLGGSWDPAVWPVERGYLVPALAALAAVAAALALGLRPLLRQPHPAADPGRAAAAGSGGAGADESARRPGRAAAAGTGTAGDPAPVRTAPEVAPATAARGDPRVPPGLAGLVAAGGVGFLLAAAGRLPVLRSVLTAVVLHAPGGGLLRDGQKFLAPTALVLALAAGHAVARLAAARRTWPYAVLLAVLPVLTLPSLAAGAGGRLAGVDYPAGWLQLRSALAAAPPGDVAVLPWQQYRRLDWNGDRVVLDPLLRLLPRPVVVNDDLPLTTGTVRGEDTRAARVTAGLAAGQDLAGLLRAAGVGYAVVHRTQPGAAAAEAAVAGLPVRYRSADLLLVDLPGPTGPAPRPRPDLGVGLGLAGIALLGALCVALRGIRPRGLLGSAGTGGPPVD